ncbi:UrcA family protein [Sphingomonas sp. 28-63-12]|uniref:UrcA family protein n=1 Tax=Sphingomonas sp. 28-63-12 TaxID=1970434 RepID=UPI000BD06AA7|nr:MAG: hypothetical protein B7Y47_06490 [Sphingomonas sp. 28-63-12]
MSITTPTLSVAVLLAATFTFSTPVLAQTTPERQIRIVTVRAADLVTEAGRATIETRLDHAANQVCTATAPTGSIITHVDRACHTVALTDARRQLAERVAAVQTGVQLAVIDTATLPR